MTMIPNDSLNTVPHTVTAAAPSDAVSIPPPDSPTVSTLYIGVDLGGDTLKIAFAYDLGKGVEYGKFAERSDVPKIALPAVAYYDKENSKWLYADQVDKHGNDSFITTVKIKHLLSMLSDQHNTAREEKNRSYYFKGSHFPKFYFPVKFAVLSDFDEMVQKKDDL